MTSLRVGIDAAGVLVKLLPVNAAQVRVRLDLLHSVAASAQSLLSAVLQQLRNRSIT